MTLPLRFWILAFPDIAKPIGGIKQLHRICEILLTLDFECTLVQENKDFHPRWFYSDVHTISRVNWLSRTDLTADRDLIILPETFLPAITTIFPSIKKIIFNQNSSYTFGLPDKSFDVLRSINFYRRSEILQVWCISEYDFQFLQSCINFPANRLFRIVNALSSTENFSHTSPKKMQIAYMPRKNSRDADIVIGLIRSQESLRSWKVISIEKCSHSEVIQILEKSLVFLSFGHPEGFGLPVAEAMACGCAVVGYTGLGGRELYEMNSSWNVSQQVEFGDWSGFIHGLHVIESMLNASSDQFLSQLASHAMAIKNHYNTSSMIDSVSLAVSKIDLNP